jgi:hypothetical protein
MPGSMPPFAGIREGRHRPPMHRYCIGTYVRVCGMCCIAYVFM